MSKVSKKIIDQTNMALEFLKQAEPLITGKIKLDDIIEKGFEELLKNRESNIKILVSP